MRRSFTLCSIGAHTLAIAALLYAQIFADSTLPPPHQPILFDAGAIMPVDIHVPPPPRRAAPHAAPESASINAAPIESPPDVAQETGREGAPEPAPPIGRVTGVEGAPPSSSFEGVGVATTAPPPEPAAPLRAGSGIRAPAKISDAAPIYPAIARTARVQGVVILEAV